MPTSFGRGGNSLVELSDGLLFFQGENSVELNLTLGSFLETADLSSQLSVVIEVYSEGSCEVLELGFVLNNGGYVLLF